MDYGTLKFKKLNSIPLEFEPNTMYAINKGESFDLYLTSSDGLSIKRVYPANNLPKVIIGDSVIQQPIIASIRVKATKGVWVADYTHCGFKTPPRVHVSSVTLIDGTDERAGSGFVLSDTITTTTCSGQLRTTTGGGLLVAIEMAKSEGYVELLLMGE